MSEKEEAKIAEEKEKITAEASTQDAQGTKTEAGDVAQKIAELETQVGEWKEKCFRAVAELDNARKRFTKEKEEVRFHTTQVICLHIIELFDSFRMGIHTAEQQKMEPKMLEGFQMIFRQFQAQLKLLQVEELNPMGAPFDPHTQEAVSHVPSDTIPEGHVVQVVRTGYKWGDRLLRAASVIVSKGKAAETIATENPGA